MAESVEKGTGWTHARLISKAPEMAEALRDVGHELECILHDARADAAFERSDVNLAVLDVAIALSERFPKVRALLAELNGGQS